VLTEKIAGEDNRSKQTHIFNPLLDAYQLEDREQFFHEFGVVKYK